MDGLTVLLLPFMLPMSFWAYASPYAWLRALPLFAALAGIFMVQKKDITAASQIAWWALLAYLFDFLALLFTKGGIEPHQSTMEWVGQPSRGITGFPLRLLELPPGAMGANYPEPEQWWIIAVNLLFWAAVAGAVVKLAERYKNWQPTMTAVPWVMALLVHQATLAMFMLWFD